MVALFVDMINEGDGKIGLTAICPFCAKLATVHGVDTEGFQRWLSGEVIQRALPDLSPGQRETLQSGYHNECYQSDPALQPGD